MPALTDEDKVIRNDVGKRIAAAIESLSAPEAEKVSYDNTESGMTADNIQDAIDELKSDIDSAKLEDLDDVNLTSPQDEDELHYDFATSKWKNIAKKIYEKSASGSLVSFNDGGDNIPLKSLIANITAVQSGSGTPSPSNIRSISGWSGANITRMGKNLLDPKDNFPLTGTLSSEYYRQIQPNVTGTGKIGFSHLELGKTYTFSCNITTDILPFSVSVGAGNGTYLTDVATQSYNASGKVSITFTVTADKLVNGDVFCFRAPRYGSATNANFTISDIMLELSDTATTYEPYKGTTHTLPFGQTVYGGTLDVLSGVLTVTEKYFSFSSASLYGNYGDDNKPLYYVDIPDYSTDIVKRMAVTSFAGVLSSNILTKISVSAENAMKNNEIRTNNALTPNRFYFRADSFADLTALNTFLSSTPLQVVASLQTPTVIHLTPAQVSTLLGLNNIFADTGDISLSYFTQNANAINDIAESNTRTALNTDVPKTDLTDIFVTGTKNNTGATISAGTYFYVNNQLALCKSAISANADLTLNTNYELVTAGVLNKLMSRENPTGTGTLTMTGDLTYNGNVSLTKLLNSYTFKSNSPITLTVNRYTTLLIIGFAQSIGSIGLMVIIEAGAISSVINLATATAFSNTHLTFSLSDNVLTIASDNANDSAFTIIRGS